MPFDIQCPSCRTAFDVPDRLAGKLIRCKTCREEFRVGRGRPADDRYADDEPPRRPSSSPLVLLLAIAGALVVGVVVVGGLGAWFWLRAKPGLRPNVNLRPAPAPAVKAEHTLPPPRPAGQFGRPAEVPAGPEAVTLSNPRRVEGSAPGRPTYQVDYAVTGRPPGAREWFYLVAKVPAGLSGVRLFRLADKPQGTFSFAFVPGHDPGRGFEVWIERGPFGKHDQRQRVSPVVRFD